MMTGESSLTEVDRPTISGCSVHILVLTTVALFAVTVSWTINGQPSAGQHETALARNAAALGHIPAAIETVKRERELVEREADAFDRFADKVKSVTVSSNSTSTVSPVLAAQTNTNGTGLRDIRNAYSTTIMDMNHFERDYGEGLRENMAIELTENVAVAVMNGHQFSQPLKQALIQQSITARSRRESLLDTIDSERESLECARQRLQGISPPSEAEADPSNLALTDLFHHHRRLRQCMSKYEHLLLDRQQHVQSNGKLQSESEQPFFQTYLYESLEVDFPVLSTVLEQYCQLRTWRRAAHQEIMNRCSRHH